MKGKDLVSLAMLLGVAFVSISIRNLVDLSDGGTKSLTFRAIDNNAMIETRKRSEPHPEPVSQVPILQVSSVLALPRVEHNDEMRSPVEDMLKVYVYDDLPRDFTFHVVDPLYDKYIYKSSPQLDLESNYKAELALLQLFENYPGRTWNPEHADVFVVPYAHACHVLGMTNDRRSNPRILASLFKSLKFRKEFKQKHVFLSLHDEGRVHFRVRMEPFRLVSGPRLPSDGSGVIVVPTFNDLPQFQPSAIVARDTEWWTRRRTYAFSYFHNEQHYPNRLGNSPNATIRFRSYFHQGLQQHKMDTLGGMSFLYKSIHDIEAEGPSLRERTIELCQDSIFCPVLAGDVAWQSRFFDAILSGCLPVVLSWKLDNGSVSWFAPPYNQHPNTSSVQESYPFVKGIFGGDERLEIDYNSFVVQCPGDLANEHDLSCLWKAMEELILQRPDEICRRQVAMKDAAVAFTYGLDALNAHQYDDAFARVIRAMRHHVLQQR